MSNVLSEEKRQQVIALGRLGWSLRRIEQATGVRRETGSAYLKAAGIAVRAPGVWGRGPAKPANDVTTGSKPELAALNHTINPENLPYKRKSNSQDSKPANEVTTGSKPELTALNRTINPENLPYERKSNSQDSKPAIQVTTGFGVGLSGGKSENPK